MLERLLSRVDHIAANVEDVTTAEAGDVKQSIKNVREITESIKSLVGTTHEQVAETGERVRGSIDKLQATIDNLDKTMKNMETVTSRSTKGEGTVGQLLTDDTIASNVEEITEDAGGFVRSITRLQTIVGPAQRVQLPRQHVQELPVGPADAPARQVLSDRAGRGPARLPRPRRSRSTTTAQTGTVVGDHGHADGAAAVHVAVRQARRGPPNMAIGGRFGIKESTGGIGGDLYLFRDRLLLSVDVFDAQGQPVPAHQGDDVVRDLAAEPVPGRAAPTTWPTTCARAGGGGAVRLVRRAGS